MRGFNRIYDYYTHGLENTFQKHLVTAQRWNLNTFKLSFAPLRPLCDYPIDFSGRSGGIPPLGRLFFLSSPRFRLRLLGPPSLCAPAWAVAVSSQRYTTLQCALAWGKVSHSRSLSTWGMNLCSKGREACESRVASPTTLDHTLWWDIYFPRMTFSNKTETLVV